MADKNNYLGFNFGDFSDPTNRTTGVPTKYLNLKGLTDFWAQIKSYIDAQDQNLFSSITSNSNKTLTIQGNGTSLGTYNGLEAKTIDITLASIGAASASHTHNYLPLTGGTMTGVINSQSIIPKTTNTYDLGSSSLKWTNVYATTFRGNAIGLTSDGVQHSALSRDLTRYPQSKTLFTGGWNTSAGNYATTFGTTLDISYSTWYQRLAFNTSGRIEYFRGINSNNTDGTAATLSKIGDLAYISDIPTTPADIGAASASHTHTRSQITDFPVVMEGKNNPSYDLNTNFTTSNIPYICRLGSHSSNSNLPTGCEYGNLVHFTGTGSDTAFDLLGDYRNTKLLFRSGNWKLDGTGTINTATWKQIAFTSDIPVSLKNPYSLTIQGNGTTIDSYDGSVAKTINITPESIGALSLSGGTITGLLSITRSPSAIKFNNSAGSTLGYIGINVDDDPVVYKADGSTMRHILHSGNYSSYAATKDHTHSVTYTPSGTVASTFSGGSVSVGASTSATTTVKSVKSVGSAPTRAEKTMPKSTHTHSVTYTPSGTVSSSFSSGSVSVGASSGTVSVASSGHTHTIDTGDLSATFTGTSTTVARTSTTGTEVASQDHTHSTDEKTLGVSYSNGVLTITSAHTHSVSATTTTGTTVASQGHTHAVTADGTISITGDNVTTGAPSGTTTVASSGHTHTGTATGTVTSTFTGTEDTVTTEATPSTECETIYSITGLGSVPTTEDVTVASTGHTHTGTATGTVTSTFTGTEDTVISDSVS